MIYKGIVNKRVSRHANRYPNHVRGSNSNNFNHNGMIQNENGNHHVYNDNNSNSGYMDYNSSSNCSFENVDGNHDNRLQPRRRNNNRGDINS